MQRLICVDTTTGCQKSGKMATWPMTVIGLSCKFEELNTSILKII